MNHREAAERWERTAYEAALNYGHQDVTGAVPVLVPMILAAMHAREARSLDAQSQRPENTAATGEVVATASHRAGARTPPADATGYRSLTRRAQGLGKRRPRRP